MNATSPKVSPSKDVVVHIEDGEAFLLHLESGVYYGLNPSGTIAWQALVEAKDPVAALTQARPDVDAAQHAQDWEALRAELVREQLVIPVDE